MIKECIDFNFITICDTRMSFRQFGEKNPHPTGLSMGFCMKDTRLNLSLNSSLAAWE